MYQSLTSISILPCFIVRIKSFGSTEASLLASSLSGILLCAGTQARTLEGKLLRRVFIAWLINGLLWLLGIDKVSIADKDPLK